MQLRWAILFPHLMKTKPALRKIALKPLSAAFTAGKS
jgi:hypothetical protein